MKAKLLIATCLVMSAFALAFTATPSKATEKTQAQVCGYVTWQSNYELGIYVSFHDNTTGANGSTYTSYSTLRWCGNLVVGDSYTISSSLYSNCSIYQGAIRGTVTAGGGGFGVGYINLVYVGRSC